MIELVRSALHQLQLFTQLRGQIFAHRGVQLWVIQAFDNAHFLNGVAFTGLVEVGFILIQMINPFKQLAAADRPGDRRAGNFQLTLDFVHHFHRIADIAVQFVHKGQNRRIAQTGYFHQLTGTIFYPFRGVDHHQAAIDGGQGTISIFGEVFVPWGIQQVNQAFAIRELHHRGGD
ncbi:hypothetical protein D3C72_1916010 [compost metagenome]